jgi:transposase
MEYFAGLDWGGSSHAACVVDQAGRIVLRTEVRNDASGLESLQRQMNRIAPATSIPIAIERPTGLIVDALLDNGHPVVAIHPKAVKAYRSRYSAAGAKNDSGDAYLLADVLRTDGHRFRLLRPASDAIKALRALVRTRDDLVAQRIALANQLRALLESFWPGAAEMFHEIDSPIALAFLERYPAPGCAVRLGEKRLKSFLASERYSGRRTAEELLRRLHAAPVGRAGSLEEQAKGELVRALARILSTLVEEIAKLTSRIEHEVVQHDDGALIMSLPYAGRLNAAHILAELGDVRERLASADQLAAEAGVAPVTRQSGKSRTVLFRWACNHNLRRAITTWAGNSRHGSTWAAHIYNAARARGCRHPHAVRVLARAWIRVLWKIWTTHAPYDPNKHTSAQPLLKNSSATG